VKKTITVNRSLTLELLDKTPYQSFIELTILQYIAYMMTCNWSMRWAMNSQPQQLMTRTRCHLYSRDDINRTTVENTRQSAAPSQLLGTAVRNVDCGLDPHSDFDPPFTFVVLLWLLSPCANVRFVFIFP